MPSKGHNIPENNFFAQFFTISFAKYYSPLITKEGSRSEDVHMLTTTTDFVKEEIKSPKINPQIAIKNSINIISTLFLLVSSTNMYKMNTKYSIICIEIIESDERMCDETISDGRAPAVITLSQIPSALSSINAAPESDDANRKHTLNS